MDDEGLRRQHLAEVRREAAEMRAWAAQVREETARQRQALLIERQIAERLRVEARWLLASASRIGRSWAP
jgi:hypothetical protein